MSAASGYATAVSVHTARDIEWVNLPESLGVSNDVVAAAARFIGPGQPDSLQFAFGGVQIPSNADVSSAVVTLRIAKAVGGVASAQVRIGSGSVSQEFSNSTLSNVEVSLSSVSAGDVNAGLVLTIAFVELIATTVNIDSVHLSVQYTNRGRRYTSSVLAPSPVVRL